MSKHAKACCRFAAVSLTVADISLKQRWLLRKQMLRLALAVLLLLLLATPALTAPTAWLDGLRALTPRSTAMELFELIHMDDRRH